MDRSTFRCKLCHCNLLHQRPMDLAPVDRVFKLRQSAIVQSHSLFPAEIWQRSMKGQFGLFQLPTCFVFDSIECLGFGFWSDTSKHLIKQTLWGARALHIEIQSWKMASSSQYLSYLLLLILICSNSSQSQFT